MIVLHGLPDRPRRIVAHVGAILLLAGLALLLALLPLRTAALLSAGTAAAILLLRRPWLALLPLAAVLPLAAGMRFGPLSAADLLLALVVALWFADGARRRTLRLIPSPPGAFVTLYLAALILSTLGAANFDEAAREVIKWIELLAVLLVAPALLSQGGRVWLAAALVLGGVGQALLGLYQFWWAIGPDYFVILGGFVRAYGSFGQPNPFGGYLGLTLPVALSLALWAWTALLRGETSESTGETGEKAGGASVRWLLMGRVALLGWAAFYSAATVTIAAGLLASWSRGAWLGAAAGVFVVLVLRSRLAALLSAGAALLVMAAVLLGLLRPGLLPAAVTEPIVSRVQDIPAYLGLTDVLSQPVTDENFSVLERVAHWVAAQRMWAQGPWLGVGPGNYAEVYPQVRLPQWEDALGHAHNVYLNVAAETGLVGLAAYIALIVALFVYVWRSSRRAKAQADATGAVHDGEYARWRAALSIGVLGILVHLCVHNIVDNLFVQGMALHLALWVALTVEE